ncbi:hypothetical protein ONZ45_g1509 [Pleurotus djamor]|nr:hypothetical protein ONZ45_g1509 [Pleurotus djamor]
MLQRQRWSKVVPSLRRESVRNCVQHPRHAIDYSNAAVGVDVALPIASEPLWQRWEHTDDRRGNGVGPLLPQPNTRTFRPIESQKKGSQAVLEALLRHNVDTVFGYPGGAILDIQNVVYGDARITPVMPRHEQGAGHMAEGYARISGKPGVVFVTSGPGATNMVTPMQDAFSDGIPLIVFSGQVPLDSAGTEAFQEADIVRIMQPCTKWSVAVNDAASLGPTIDEAFRLAASGRPGPVLVDIPSCVAASTFSQRASPHLSSSPFRPEPRQRSGACLEEVASMINNAKTPLIIAGAGVRSADAQRLLSELAQKGNIPVATTLHGLGSFDERDSKSLQMVGVHGSVPANYAVQRADVVVALGARLDERVTANKKHFAPVARSAATCGSGGIIQFEIDPARVGKCLSVDLAVIGDVAQNLASLIPLVHHRARHDWWDHISDWKERLPFSYHVSGHSERPKPQSVIEELDRQSSAIEDVVITTGVGNHQMWAAQHFTWTPRRTLVSSGSFGTMGFGLPAALGAKLASPDRTVIDIDGDGSFLMTAAELATASELSIGVKVLIFNNNSLAMVDRWQVQHYGKTIFPMKNPDFTKLAESMGVKALRCTSNEELPRKIQQFLHYDNNLPIVLECFVDKDEEVWPLRLPGQALHQFKMHPSLPLKRATDS